MNNESCLSRNEICNFLQKTQDFGVISAAHFSCLKFFAKNEKNQPIFREKRKIREKSIFYCSSISAKGAL